MVVPGIESPDSARRTARSLTRGLVAARLQVLMFERGISSVRALAQLSGLGIGTVANLVRGESDPTLSTMLALAAALDLHSIEELIAPLGTSIALRGVTA